MISYIMLSMPHVLTLYYLAYSLYHYQSTSIPYPNVITLFISLNMFYTVHSLLQICLFFIILTLV